VEERQYGEEDVTLREEVSIASAAHFKDRVDAIVGYFDALAKAGCTGRIKHGASLTYTQNHISNN